MNRNSFFPERLTWIRKKRGLTKSALAKLLGIDLRSMSAYEAGEYEPNQDKTTKLHIALNVKPGFFSAGPLEGPEAEQVSFRALSKLTAAKRDMALGSAAIAFSFCDWMNEKYHLPKVDIPDIREINDPEQAAISLRYKWGLGERPVSNMVHLLESKGVRVFSLALDIEEVDACCTWHNDIPFVFLNTKKSNARRRFDAAHELGHLVLHKHGAYEGRVTEREADRFASAFLMPRGGFSATAPRLPNLKNIIENKKKWGVSVAAYIVRLHRLELVSDWQYQSLFRHISKLGYRKREPYDHKTELSKMAELLLGELRKEGIGIGEVADILLVSSEDISDLLFNLAIFEVKRNLGSLAAPRSNNHLKLIVDNVSSETEGGASGEDRN